MSSLGWHHPYLVDNTDTQYLGNQNWQQFWRFRFFSFFASTCFSTCHSVCVSVHLFKINLKFLKTYNYWLGQVSYVSFVSGLELKACRMYIKMLKNSSKISWGRHYCQDLGQNSLFSNLSYYCYHDCYGSNSVIRVVVKFCWLTKIIFQVFCVFLLKLKGELVLAYESYAGGILIVILIEILNDYCLISY